MSQALHIFKKDLRRGWPLLLLWGSALILWPASTWNDPMELPLSRGDGGGTQALLMTLAAMVAVATSVQYDSLVGRREFWMTRPIRPWALMAAKGMYVGLFFVAPPVLLQFAALVYLGLPSGLWPAHLAGIAVLWASLLAFAALLGAWTKGLPGFFTLLAAFVIGPSLLLGLLAEYLGSEVGFSVDLPFSTGALYFLLLAVQYGTRKRALGALLGVTAFPLLWHSPLPFPIDVYPARALQTRLGEMKVELTAGPHRDTLPATRFYRGSFASTKLWLLPAPIEAPRDSILQLSGGDGEIQWLDGSRSRVAFGGGWRAPGPLQGLHWAPGRAPSPSWQNATIRREGSFEKVLGRAGRLRTESSAYLWNAAEVLSLPLKAGAEVVRDDFRARVLRVESGFQPFQLVIRRRSIPPVGRLPIVQEPQFFLANRPRGEILPLYPTYGGVRRPFGWFMTSGGLLEVREDAWTVGSGSAAPIPASWLEDAEALVAFYELAGKLDVELEAASFQVDAVESPEPIDPSRAQF